MGIGARASRSYYTAFLVDADTGADALVYNQSRPNPCGLPGATAPSVGVPAEEVSVPWTLLSRSANGYSAQISVSAPPCYGIPNPVLADRSRPAVSVVALGPVNASCGPSAHVTVQLHAATITSRLPAEIGHDPLGPYLGPNEW